MGKTQVMHELQLILHSVSVCVCEKNWFVETFCYLVPADGVSQSLLTAYCFCGDLHDT